VDDEPMSLLDRDQAAERLCVSRRTVVRYGKAGLLDERRIGPKLVRITAESVEALKRKGDDAA
jgi:excisionase family DNA binding protein